MQKKDLYQTVFEVLREHTDARNSDYVLFYKVCKKLGVPIDAMTATDLLFMRKQFCVPSFKSVERCRRKVQEQNECLASEKIRQRRSVLEGEYRNAFRK